MARLKVKCKSTKPYLQEVENGLLMEGEFEGELIDLTLGKVYKVLEEEQGYYRLVDNTGEDYLYPKEMFEVVSLN